MSAVLAPSEDVSIDRDYRLEDRYLKRSGRVFLTGTQALVRALLDQSARDAAAGLDTAGFVSGYRGSPLAGLDLELWRAKKHLSDARVDFLPAVNEDLAVTAVFGTQQVESNPDRTVTGVFGMWYGKGPGVDRSGDALKHANAYGSSPHGGVLVVAGDDHGGVSSTIPHQSDVAFMSWFIPTLHPATLEEYLTFAEYGYAVSRYSGMWVGFKAIAETVEAAQSIELPEARVFQTPDFVIPPTGLHYRWPDFPGQQIDTRFETKKNAVLAFLDANPIDRRIYDVAHATYGIVTTGKAHLDLMEALRLLGLDEAECRRLGIDVYKVGMVWPLARRDALEFVRHKHEVLVVEEKRGLVESQLKEYFYDFPGEKPKEMVGKKDENGIDLMPWTGELSPRMLAPIVAKRLEMFFPGLGLEKRAAELRGLDSRLIEVPGATRTPYFCSGCPHNSSTRVPEGSKALGGIGCHIMATLMDRDTTSVTHMGGEGANWVGASRYVGNRHIFQNLGDGTYYHSGSLAIRQAVAAKTNITYKILYNDAVAMTGGQPLEGSLSPEAIAHSCRREGVERIAIVSDMPEKFSLADLPPRATIHHRSQLDAVQRELREIEGVSVLVYEQTCATEKRRRRKRGEMIDPPRFAYINDLVCEGCGDCSVESNCLSVEPKETPLGRKRKINLSSCNKDFSCLNGFCPSFVTIEGGKRKKREGAGIDAEARAATLPLPRLPSLNDKPFDLLVTGVGGTGVVTVGQLVTMAAHLEGRGSSVLDFTGFAQKFGPVMSYIRLAERPGAINQVRIDEGAADALIGCDLVVSSSPKASGTYKPGMRMVMNSAEMPTGDVVRIRDADLAARQRLKAIERVAGPGNMATIDANKAADALLGDAVFANVMMLGFGWQQGLVPVGLDAMMRAIELNGVQVEKNRQAFAFGRIASVDPKGFAEMSGAKPAVTDKTETLDEQIARRAAFLVDYQDAAYSKRYLGLVERVRAAEKRAGSEALTGAVARSLFKLMAYKDEYEVARLHMETGFLDEIAREFEGDYTVKYYLAPPSLSGPLDARGRPVKRTFGAWIQTPFKLLARLKRLRGTRLDVFGYTAERRMERGLIAWYEGVVETLLSRLGREDAARLAEIAAMPMDIRGYGPVKQSATEAVQARVEDRIAGTGAIAAAA